MQYINENRREKLKKEFLRQFKCIDSDCSDGAIIHDIGGGSVELEQCQFCDIYRYKTIQYILNKVEELVAERVSESDVLKLQALARLCREDDLLDVESNDSITRADMISDAWEALKVIDMLSLTPKK